MEILHSRRSKRHHVGLDKCFESVTDIFCINNVKVKRIYAVCAAK